MHPADRRACDTLAALGLAPGAALAEEVELGPRSDGKSVACLGAGGIAAKNDGKDQFSGSYVYYGTYDGTPTRYRVLANGTTDFTGEGKPTMLLDCDTVLAKTVYGETRAWAGSTLQAWVTIGDDGAFGAEGDKKGVFTAPEKAAIAESNTTAGEDPTATDKLGKDFKLTGERAFVLSAGEANAYYADNDARKKDGAAVGFSWLRTAGAPSYGASAAVVYGDGHVDSDGYPVDSVSVGVSPAFNINLKL